MTKKLVSILLALVLIVSSLGVISVLPAGAATAPSITLNAVTKLTNNNAQINAKINNPSKVKITKVGFQLGTKSGTWTTTKSESISMTSAFNAYYLMSKWYGKLKSNTTYYYRFFITAGGSNKYSSISSFKTIDETPKITVNSVTNLTGTNAQINAKISNPYKVKVTKVGFQLGTKSGTWTTTKSENISQTSDFTAYYLMSKWYGTLKAGITYYYRFFITVNSKNTYSAIKNFKTIPPTTTPSTTTTKQTYPKITSLRITRTYQPLNDIHCLQYAKANAYAYMYKNYRSAGTDKEVAFSTINSWSTKSKAIQYGNRKSMSLSKIYDQLKNGVPVVIYYSYYNGSYNTGHASVIIGYCGSTSKLEEKGFVVMEIKQTQHYSNSPEKFKTYSNNPCTTAWDPDSCYIRLDTWLNYQESQGTRTAITLFVPTK